MKGQGKTAFKILFPVPHMTWSFLQQKIACSQEEVAEVGAIQDF
jgi:hypothetical protein